MLIILIDKFRSNSWTKWFEEVAKYTSEHINISGTIGSNKLINFAFKIETNFAKYTYDITYYNLDNGNDNRVFIWN